jgi:hypothetical protein
MDHPQTPAQTGDRTGGMLRPVLWFVLVVSAALNAVFSSTGRNVWLGVAFGLVTLASIAALVVHHYHHRAR